MKFKIFGLLLPVFISSSLFGQKAVVQSPNKKISVELFSKQGNDIGEWGLNASYNNNGKITAAIPWINLGLSRNDQDFNAEQSEKTKTVKFDFLPDGINYKLTLIADGKHDKDFATKYMVVDRSGSVDVKLLRRGGFALSLVHIQ